MNIRNYTEIKANKITIIKDDGTESDISNVMGTIQTATIDTSNLINTIQNNINNKDSYLENLINTTNNNLNNNYYNKTYLYNRNETNTLLDNKQNKLNSLLSTNNITCNNIISNNIYDKIYIDGIVNDLTNTKIGIVFFEDCLNNLIQLKLNNFDRNITCNSICSNSLKTTNIVANSITADNLYNKTYIDGIKLSLDNSIYHILNNFNLGEMQYTISHDDNKVYLNYYDNYGGAATDSLLNMCYWEIDRNNKTSSFKIDEIYLGTNSLTTLLNNKANQTSTYTKTEVDSLLITSSAVQASNTYSKTSIDVLLNDKADKTTSYLKTQIDTFLNNKANTTSIYTRTETDFLLTSKAATSSIYTRSETDSLLNNKQVILNSLTNNITCNNIITNNIYTKSETDNLLVNKQSSISPTSNLTLNNITVSSTLNFINNNTVKIVENKLVPSTIDINGNAVPSFNISPLTMYCNNAFDIKVNNSSVLSHNTISGLYINSYCESGYDIKCNNIIASNLYSTSTIDTKLSLKQDLLNSSSNLTINNISVGSNISSKLNLYYNSLSDSGMDQALSINCKSAFKFIVNNTPRFTYDYLGFVMNDFCEIKSLSVLNTTNCIGNLTAPNIYQKSETYSNTEINNLLLTKQNILNSSTNIIVNNITVGTNISSKLNLYYNSITDSGADQTLSINCKSAFKFVVNAAPKFTYDYLGFVMNDFCEIKSLAVLQNINCIGDLSANNIYTKTEVDTLKKPYIGMKVVTNTITHFGQYTAITLSRTSGPNLYTFTMSSSHPAGDFMIIASLITPLTTTVPQKITVNVSSGTNQFFVFVRNWSSNALEDGSFFLHSIP